MEGNVGNRRNDHHHESHHHHHENHHHHDHHPHHQIQCNFSQEPSTSTHFPPFGQLSTSSSSPPLSSFNNQNNHHFDAFLHSPAYLPVEAKASQPFLFPSTDFLDSDFPHHSPGVPSDSLTLKIGKRHYYENASSGALEKLSPADEPRVSGFSLLKRGREFLSHFHLHHHHHHDHYHCQYQPSLASSSTPQSMLASGAAILGTPVPRCQVEGCNVGLMGAKEYHRRHKVCEMHSKAPKVIIQGIEQRFCQQCSRFHVVSEFDDSKRSCRRRLAGHNERRRKNSSDFTTRNSSQEGRVGGRLPLARNTSTSSSTGRALSLLSAEGSPTRSSSAAAAPADDDLSSRSSAALRELIAENRAAALAKQLAPQDDGSVLPHDYRGNGHNHQPLFTLYPGHNHQPLFTLSHAAQGRDAQPHQAVMFEPVPATTATTTTTLELMQATHVQSQHPSYQLMAPSGRLGAVEDEDSIECEIWRSIE